MCCFGGSMGEPLGSNVPYKTYIHFSASPLLSNDFTRFLLYTFHVPDLEQVIRE